LPQTIVRALMQAGYTIIALIILVALLGWNSLGPGEQLLILISLAIGTTFIAVSIYLLKKGSAST